MLDNCSNVIMTQQQGDDKAVNRLCLHLSSLCRNFAIFPGAFKGLDTFRKNLIKQQSLDPVLLGHILPKQLINKLKYHDEGYTLYKETRSKIFLRMIFGINGVGKHERTVIK